MSLYGRHASGSSSSAQHQPPRATEFDILRASHRFLHDDPDETRNLTWDEQLARKYYSSLFREFAVCDLKHYKTGNFALRWRTEAEVLSGVGEKTCANARCHDHQPTSDQLADADAPPAIPLTTLELPFAYEERGERKNALVKVVLCSRCVKKLMWKRNKERERKDQEGSDAARGTRHGNEGELGAVSYSQVVAWRGRDRQINSREPKAKEEILGNNDSTRHKAAEESRTTWNTSEGSRNEGEVRGNRRRNSRSISPARRRAESKSGRHQRTRSPRR